MAPGNIDFPPFEPHPLLFRAGLMTLAGSLPRMALRNLQRSADRREVQVDASTRVVVHLDRPRARRSSSALVLAHGLVGSGESVYMLGTAAKARAAGFLVARVTARNCGDTEHLTTTAYHGGLTADVEAAARHLLRHEAVDRVHLAGFSIGANGVLKLAAGWGDAPPAWAASIGVVSPCVDFASSAEALQRGLYGRLIQRRFLKGLRRIVRRRHALEPGSVSLAGLERIRTLRAFDHRYTAPMSGFADVDDYYARASALADLPAIRTPTLIVTARDDPLVPFASFRGAEIAGNPRLMLLAPERGGHVAFIGRTSIRTRAWNDRDRFWAENRLVQFALAHEMG